MIRSVAAEDAIARRLGLMLLRYGSEICYVASTPQFRHGPSKEVEEPWTWGQPDWAGEEDPIHALSAKGLLRYAIDYQKCMFCALCVDPCPVDCIFMGATHDLSCYSRDGCLVDYSRLPVDVGWGRATLNPTAVAQSKVLVDPIHSGPNQ